MKKTIFGMVISVFVGLIFSGCGNDNTFHSGNFTGIHVEGLQYTTKTLSRKTLSGKTDASGRFYYRGNETVAFSIGGLVLGEAAGDKEITPFDLCGVTPVNDEKELKAYLKKSPSPAFTRLINIVVLLQSLDQANDPESGIVISEEVGKLVSADSFDLTTNSDEFNLQLREFYLKARDAGIKTRMMLPLTAINKLYEGMAIKTSLKQIKRISIDTDDDGSEDHYISFDYNIAGQLTFKEENLAGLNNTESRTYDDKARLVSITRELTEEIEPLTRTETENYTYDETGEIIKEEAQITVNDQTQSRSVTYHYDETGRIVKREEQAVSEGATSTEIILFSYDDNGNPEGSEMQSTIVDGEEVITEAETIKYKYNEDKQPIEQEMTSTINRNDEILIYNALMTIAYNGDGQPLKTETSYDYNGRTRSVVQLFYYNEFGQPVTQESSAEETSNDNIRTSLQTYEFAYNQYGFLDTQTATTQSLYNNELQQRKLQIIDSNNNITHYEQFYSNDKMTSQNQSDRKIALENLNSSFTYSCDENNNIITAIADRDSDGEPEITQAFEYDNMGYVLSRRLTDEDSDTKFTYSYNEDYLSKDVDSSSFNDIYYLRFDAGFYFSYDSQDNN